MRVLRFVVDLRMAGLGFVVGVLGAWTRAPIASDCDLPIGPGNTYQVWFESLEPWDAAVDTGVSLDDVMPDYMYVELPPLAHQDGLLGFDGGLDSDFHLTVDEVSP